MASLAVAFVLASLPAPASAHEFWLEPVDYRPKVRESVPIVHRNGQSLVGDSYPYLKSLTRRFSVVEGRRERPVKAIEGDDPAAEITFREKGLAIVVYDRLPEMVVFDSFERFEESVSEEGHAAIAARHRAEGRPAAPIREQFSRSAKALVQVGGGNGDDRPIGLPIEIVAEKSPYALAPGEKLPVRVLLQGRPLAEVLVKTFHLKLPESPLRVRADAEGRALLDLPLAGEYLVSAVHMEAASEKGKADWRSLWASLTFRRP